MLPEQLGRSRERTRREKADATSNPYTHDPRVFSAWYREYCEKLPALRTKHPNLTITEYWAATFLDQSESMPSGSKYRTAAKLLKAVGITTPSYSSPFAFMNDEVQAQLFGDSFASSRELAAEGLKPENLEKTLSFIAYQLPYWCIHSPEHNRTVTLLSPEVVTAPLYLIVHQLFTEMLQENRAIYFNFPDKNLGDELRRNLVLLGTLCGEFAHETPRAISLRMLLTPHIQPSDPDFVQRLRWDADTDAEPLKKLKGFWHETFGAYWLTSARVHGYDSAQPLNRDLQQEARRKVPVYYTTPSSRNENSVPQSGVHRRMQNAHTDGIQGLQLSIHTHRLREYIAALLQSYATPERAPRITPQLLREVLPKHLTNQIFCTLSVHLAAFEKLPISANELQPLAHELISILKQPHSDNSQFETSLEAVMGRSFQSLSPIEVVCLIGFAAFLQNGSRSREEVAAVEQIQLKLIPTLSTLHTAYTDLDTETIHAPLHEDWLRAKEYAPVAFATILPQSYCFRADSPEILDRIQTYQEELESAWARDIDHLSKYSVSLSTQAHNEVFHVLLSAGIAIFAVNVLFAQTPEWANQHLRTVILLAALYAGTFALTREYRISEKLTSARMLVSSQRFTESVQQQLRNELDSLQKAGFTIFLVLALIFGAARELERQEFRLSDIFPALESVDESPPTQNRPVPISRTGIPSEYVLYNSSDLAERVDGAQPRFFVYNAPRSLFWADTVCQAYLQQEGENPGPPFECDRIIETLQQRFSIDTFDDLAQFREQVQRAVAAGMLVRMNYTNHTEYGNPAGYQPVRALIYDPDWGKEKARGHAPYADWHSASGVELITMADPKLSAVVYEPIPGASSTTLAENTVRVPIESESALTAEHRAHHDFKVIANIIETAQQAQADGKTTREVLESIRSGIEDLGVEYGYANYTPLGWSAADELLWLFEQRADGSLAHTKWICNQFAFVVHMVAKEVGIQTHLILGALSDPSRPDNGYNNQLHALVRFQNESGGYEIFEATLPSSQFLNDQPAPEPVAGPLESSWETERAVQLERLVLLVLLCIVLLELGASHARDIHRKRTGARILELRNFFFERVAAVSDATRLAFWLALMSALGTTGVFTQKNGSDTAAPQPQNPEAPFTQVHSFRKLGFVQLNQPHQTARTEAPHLSPADWAAHTAQDVSVILDFQTQVGTHARELEAQLDAVLDELQADRHIPDKTISTVAFVQAAVQTFQPTQSERRVTIEKLQLLLAALKAIPESSSAGKRNRSEFTSLLEDFLHTLQGSRAGSYSVRTQRTSVE